jgi:uncharacterized protein
LTLTTYLADVNVWVALSLVGHTHHAEARRWFEEEETTAVSFCRVTQAGFLRLLGNPRVMGPNVLNAQAAWAVFDTLSGDPRITFAAEPPNIESHWRDATRHQSVGPNFWTDAYLMAFAAASDMTIVTFDHAFTRQRKARVHLLKP